MVYVLVYYGARPFGIEVSHSEALDIINAYFDQDTEVVEVEGYGIYPKEVIKIELTLSNIRRDNE